LRNEHAVVASIAAALILVFGAANATAQAKQEASKSTTQEARIARIENGLLPAVVIKGQPLPRRKMAEEMARLKVPGVSVAFYDHGKIVWTRTYGYADVAAKKRVTTDTLFQAASISKPVGALATLRLVQQGKLNLDENVNDKLREWKVPDNQFTTTEKVTLRRILSHSAGLTVHGFAGYAAGEPVPTIVQVLNGEKPANSPPVRVDVTPGTIWRYSGGGYVVMQLLLTEQTKETFPALLHNMVLWPAGMTHSTYHQPIPAELRRFVATPYRASGEPVKGGPHTYPEMAPAGLWTTPSDLDRLAIELIKEYEGTSSKILSQAMMRQMLTPQKDDWGLGFALGPAPNKLVGFGHGGANEGYRSEWQNYVGLQQGVAIMTNSDSGGEVAEEYLRAVAKEYGWPDFRPKERAVAKVDAAIYSRYAGTYESTDLGKINVMAKGGKLYLQTEAFGAAAVELLPESETSFFALIGDATFTFEKGEKAPAMVIQAGTQKFVAKRVHR
jgi:CubicO group peptidase (beta-lactamase class C family)